MRKREKERDRKKEKEREKKGHVTVLLGSPWVPALPGTAIIRPL